MTIHEILKQTNNQIDLLDAELLLAHVTKKIREFLIMYPGHKLSLGQKIKFKNFVRKRKKGVPFAYLVKKREFYGLDFFVNKHTIVPRPSTEGMVDEAVSRVTNHLANGQKVTLIDVGTGSGCVPIAIIKTLQRFDTSALETYAMDISKHALRVARINAKKHNCDIKFLHGNLFEPFTKISKFEIRNSKLIVTANLPYVSAEQYSKLPFLRHEPKIAITSAKDGLALYEELLKQIRQLVNNHQLPITSYFEIDPSQAHQITQVIKTYLPKSHIVIKKDLAGRDRVVTISA